MTGLLSGFPVVYFLACHGEVRKVTDLQVGVSGITQLSPCFDIAAESNEIVYILYNNTNYELHKTDIEELDGPVFSAGDVDLSAAQLPPVDREEHRIDAPESFYLARTYLAYVGDGSRFGFTSPMSGYRYLLNQFISRHD